MYGKVNQSKEAHKHVMVYRRNAVQAGMAYGRCKYRQQKTRYRTHGRHVRRYTAGQYTNQPQAGNKAGRQQKAQKKVYSNKRKEGRTGG